MRNGVKCRWLISVGVVLAVLAAVSLFVPIQYDLCAKNAYTNQKECAAYHVAPFIVLYIGEFLEAHAGAITAIATGFIAWFTLTLYEATTQQSRITNAALELARDEFNATHRPRLVVRFIMPEALRPMETPRAQIIVDNIGDLTAYVTHVAGDIEQRVSATWIGMPLFPTGSPIAPESVIAPGGRDWFSVHGNWPLNAESIAAVESGITKLILVGHFQYRDDNNVIRYTGFFRQFDPADGSYRQVDPPSEREYAS